MNAAASAVAGFVWLGLLGAGGCRQSRPMASEPLQTMEDFTLHQTVDGALVWELEARSAVLREEGGDAQLASPTMRFYRKGKVVSRLRAQSGRVIVESHDVFLSSSVVVETTEEHSVLKTETLN